MYAGGNVCIKSKYKETILTFYFNFLLKERLGLCKYSPYLQWSVVLELVTQIRKNMVQSKKRQSKNFCSVFQLSWKFCNRVPCWRQMQLYWHLNYMRIVLLLDWCKRMSHAWGSSPRYTAICINYKKKLTHFPDLHLFSLVTCPQFNHAASICKNYLTLMTQTSALNRLQI